MGGREPPRLYSKALLLSLAASQVVTMHDLKQGLGPSGTAGLRKSASNKYKLKVGAPEPTSAAALRLRGPMAPRVGVPDTAHPQGESSP